MSAKGAAMIKVVLACVSAFPTIISEAALLQLLPLKCIPLKCQDEKTGSTGSVLV